LAGATRVSGDLSFVGNRSNRRCRIKSENTAELDEFDDIDAPLTAFEPRDERLILAKPFRQLRLGHTGCLAPFDEERDKGLMPI
jgi:hypothetical protein